MVFNKNIRGLLLVLSFMFQACSPMKYDDDMKYLTKGMRELCTITSKLINQVNMQNNSKNGQVPTLIELASVVSLQEVIFYFIIRDQKIPRNIMDNFFRYRQRRLKKYSKNFTRSLIEKFENCKNEQEFVRFIVKHMLNGCSYHSMGWNGKSLSQYAGEKNFLLLRRVLLNCGLPDEEISSKMEKSHYGLLGHEYMYSKLKHDILPLLAKQGVQANVQFMPDEIDANPISLLVYACKFGDLESVKYLVNSGASIYMCTDDGLTPFLVAIAEGELNIVKYFLKLDPNLIYQTFNGKNAFCAMMYRTTNEVIEELIACGVCPINVDEEGANASDKAQSIVCSDRLSGMTQDIVGKLKQYELEYTAKYIK